MKTKLLSLLLLVSKITLQLDGKDKIRIMCAIVALPPAESNFRSPQNFVFNVQLSNVLQTSVLTLAVKELSSQLV